MCFPVVIPCGRHWPDGLVNHLFDCAVKETGVVLNRKTADRIKEATKFAATTAREVSPYLLRRYSRYDEIDGPFLCRVGKLDAEDLKFAIEQAGIAWDQIDPDLITAMLTAEHAFPANSVSTAMLTIDGQNMPRPRFVAATTDGYLFAKLRGLTTTRTAPHRHEAATVLPHNAFWETTLIVVFGLAAALAAPMAPMALVEGLNWLTHTNQAEDRLADCQQHQDLGKGGIGRPLSLLNTDGQAVTEAEIFTKPTLLYFGYTSCTDICPMDNARNAEAVDILEERGFDVQPAFISIDPARDTPDVMRGFAANLHSKMIGLTGTEEQVMSAVQAYNAYAKKQDAGVEFDHSTFTYLVLPDVGLVGFFKREATAHDVATEAACLITKAQR